MTMSATRVLLFSEFADWKLLFHGAALCMSKSF